MIGGGRSEIDRLSFSDKISDATPDRGRAGVRCLSIPHSL